MLVHAPRDCQLCTPAGAPPPAVCERSRIQWRGPLGSQSQLMGDRKVQIGGHVFCILSRLFPYGAWDMIKPGFRILFLHWPFVSKALLSLLWSFLSVSRINGRTVTGADGVRDLLSGFMNSAPIFYRSATVSCMCSSHMCKSSLALWS